MPYFVSESALIPGETLAVAGPEAAHILKSRRLRKGARFAMQDPAGLRCLVELTGVKGPRAVVRVLEELPLPAAPPLNLHLLQAAVKDKAAELIVQKATELGAARVSFFPAANSPGAPKKPADAKALARWEKIAAEACKQCDRQFPPALTLLPDFAAALAENNAASISWLLHPGGQPAAKALTIQEPPPNQSAARVLVGPEGGFSGEEVAQARAAGFTPVGLGGNTLRAETAALAACALLLLGSG